MKDLRSDHDSSTALPETWLRNLLNDAHRDAILRQYDSKDQTGRASSYLFIIKNSCQAKAQVKRTTRTFGVGGVMAGGREERTMNN